ncbi:WD40-repeat-containing domain protein, partial [Tirmania nivea]
MTAEEYFDEGLNEGYDEPIIDIESDNFDFSRLFRRLYDYYPFDPTTFRLTSLAAQIKSLKRPEVVTKEDMEANGGDYQGIPWGNLRMTRDEFRVLRNRTYKNYRNMPYPDPLPTNRQFFRFNGQENTKWTRVVHFQLRNLLSVTSRHDIFYSSEHCRIRRTGVGSKTSETIIDLSTGVPVKITTMTARHGVIVAGGFSGEYAVKSLHAPFESKPIIGIITRNDNGITNHVHAHLGRNSGSPVAVFSSNDNKLRVLDCYRDTFIGEQGFEWPINCSATSPDGRLRVVVGDHTDVMIVEADSGRILRTLEGHEDYGFSCAWSDDGYSIATGNQDRTVRIYDARNFSRSITQIGTNIAGVRTLRFSESGCGRRVLVCPEPADYVNIIDAVTWDGMQKFDFFGEIAGVEFSPKGGEMFVANADLCVGGLMEFERC